MANPILLVFTGIIAIVGFGAAYFLVYPIFLKILHNPTSACQASTNCTDIFDHYGTSMFYAIEIMFGGIFFALYMRAIRKDETESYNSSGFEGF